MKLILPILFAFALPILASEEDKQALRDLREVYEQAIAKREVSLLKPHLAEDFTGVMITADEIEGFAGIEAYWAKVMGYLGEDGTYQVTLDPDDSYFEGNLAIAKGRALEQVVRNGKPIEFTSNWTAIARKEGDAWKLVRIQATIDPLGNPFVAAIQRVKIWTIGGACLLGGLIIGRLLPRRKRPA